MKRASLITNFGDPAPPFFLLCEALTGVLSFLN
jgi:hypothetical protein